MVAGYARRLGVQPPSREKWAALSPLQRFVSIKLTRDNHDNVNFIPAMREFGLGRPTVGSVLPATRVLSRVWSDFAHLDNAG